MEATTKARGIRKTRTGDVVSRSGDKSIVVQVSTRKRHPIYGKVITTSKKYHAHDEANEAGVGDVVRISESRPISKQKRWRLVEVLEKRS
jgi:small subunit ribosomal protein S17